MKPLELRARRLPRRDALDLRPCGRSLELAAKHVVSVRPERMTVGKTVSGDLGTGYQDGAISHRRFRAVFIERAFTDNPPPAITATSMAQYIYTMNRVAKVVPPKRYILRDISLSFFPGAKIGVLGLNGSGKSTLLRIMAGVDKDIDGEARPQAGINIGYLPQEPELDPSKTVRGIVEEGITGLTGLIARFNEISDRFAEPLEEEEMNRLLEEQGKLQDQIDAAGGWELERKFEIAADALRLPPWDAEIESLSGGERRRVALCRLLLSNPDMLLLDEPTNHLDAESVAWLERFLDEFPGTVVAVTHDRYFLDNVAGWILELDRGHGIPWQGNYSSWLEQKEQRLALEEKQEVARQRAIKTELEWVRTNPKARQAKAKARMQRFEELNSKEFQTRNETNEIYIPPGPRLGDLVIEAQDLRKAFGDRLLFENLSFSLPPGGIVGVIGPNGAGKTTLFRIMLGHEQADQGTVTIGNSVQLAYVDQSRDVLDDAKSVWEEISDGQDILRVGSYETPSRAYVGRFNFRGAEQQKQVGLLSGGERNRVHLAKLLKTGGNVLFLDEPTNDLDVETLRALEEALLNFPGCAVVISHDRWFLDRIATHILAFEGNSEVVYFQGNYADYAADLKRRKGEDADQPHRIRYKRLGS
jgi:ATP-binding cassette ChvD family protein